MDNTQPNELDNQPKVSNNPYARPPEVTRGHIQDILRDNPQAVLRRVKHKQALQATLITFVLVSIPSCYLNTYSTT